MSSENIYELLAVDITKTMLLELELLAVIPT